MLMEEFQTDQSSKFMELKNVNRQISDWLERIVYENKGDIARKEWKSKYNSYVVYDYEPFCSEGFEINVLVSAPDFTFLNFIKFLYDQKVSTIEYLNNCMA